MGLYKTKENVTYAGFRVKYVINLTNQTSLILGENVIDYFVFEDVQNCTKRAFTRKIL